MKWKQSVLGVEGTIADAIRIIDASSTQICLMLDTSERLVGTITDGDVRRGILRGIPLAAPAIEVMNHNPKTASPTDDPDRLQTMMEDLFIRQLPIVDGHGRLMGLVTAQEIAAGQTEARENEVVLMAGGLGSRLRPLTENTPKPLLKVGEKPLLETILETFIHYRFRRFRISVNYRADMVKEYFGDGSKWGCSISYIEETERMGTAGALGIMGERPTAPFIVMNGDVLTKVNFVSLLEFHSEHQSKATMCVREYDLQVPYGVVTIDRHRITGIVEKPVHSFFVNAGIYALDPSALDLIPPGRYFDMTELFQQVIESGEENAVFPIREYWMDIGHMDDFLRANGDFPKIFG